MKAYLEPEEVQRLEQAAEYLRDRLLVWLLWRLGCRISEVLGIGVGEIDFAQGTVTIEHLKVRLKLSCPQCGTRLSRTARFCPGCGSGVEKAVSEELEHRRKRTLPVDRDTLEMLRDYIRQGGPLDDGGRRLLFGISRGHAWHIIRECAQRAGLGDLVNPETGEVRGISPHRLRDAHAIHAIKVDDSTDSVRLLQEMLGHKSIVTTMKYRKVSGEELKAWSERIWAQSQN